MVKGSTPDRPSHLRSKPGSDSAVDSVIDGLIRMHRVVQRSGVAHASSRHFWHTDPNFKGTAHSFRIDFHCPCTPFGSSFLFFNVGSERRRIWEAISGGNLCIKGSWIAFLAVPMVSYFAFSSFIWRDMAALSAHGEQGPPSNTTQASSASIPLHSTAISSTWVWITGRESRSSS